MHRNDHVRLVVSTPCESPLVASKAPIAPRDESGEPALDGTLVPRKVSRTVDHRRKSREHGYAETAWVHWDEGEAPGKVLNVSERGLMMEVVITAGIGDVVQICFEGCDPIPASVIWRKEYRVGLDLGQAARDSFPEPKRYLVPFEASLRSSGGKVLGL